MRARCSRAGESALTRGPSSASTAPSGISAAVAANSVTIAAAIPIEESIRCGKTSSESSATDTVSEENATVRPAVPSVRSSASAQCPQRASSSR